MPGNPKLYTIRPMDYMIVDSVSSEATGHPVEKALDRNLDTYWSPTTTASQTIVLDRQDDRQERIVHAFDREFSADTGHWANTDMGTWTISGGVLSCAGDIWEYGSLIAPGFKGFEAGKAYKIIYDATISTGGARFQCGGSDQVIGSLVHGTTQAMTFSCTTDSNSFVVACTSNTTAFTLDNVSILWLAEDYAVQGYGFWVRNYDTHFADLTIKLEYSDDKVNWTEQCDREIMDEMTNGLGNPLRIYAWDGDAQVHRYWRLTLADADIIIQLSQIFLLNEFAPGMSNVYPEINGRSYHNTKRRGIGRRLIVEPGHRTPVQVFDRQYRLFNDTQLAGFQNAFDACRGGATPMVLNEGSDYYVVRIITENFAPRSIDYQVYDLALQFETLPYIADGDVL